MMENAPQGLEPTEDDEIDVMFVNVREYRIRRIAATHCTGRLEVPRLGLLNDVGGDFLGTVLEAFL